MARKESEIQFGKTPTNTSGKKNPKYRYSVWTRNLGNNNAEKLH